MPYAPISSCGHRLLSSGVPSEHPSLLPSSIPSEHPSGEYSYTLSKFSTFLPSYAPNSSCGHRPLSSGVPSEHPSLLPSSQPSVIPSLSPSISAQPSSIPSESPSDRPSSIPSVLPSSIPSVLPSSIPSKQPSGQPSVIPSESPSISQHPSESPSANPSQGCDNIRDGCGWGIFNPWTCQCDCPVGICRDNNGYCLNPCQETINVNPWSGCAPGWGKSSRKHAVSTSLVVSPLYQVSNLFSLLCRLPLAPLGRWGVLQVGVSHPERV